MNLTLLNVQKITANKEEINDAITVKVMIVFHYIISIKSKCKHVIGSSILQIRVRVML